MGLVRPCNKLFMENNQVCRSAAGSDDDQNNAPARDESGRPKKKKKNADKLQSLVLTVCGRQGAFTLFQDMHLRRCCEECPGALRCKHRFIKMKPVPTDPQLAIFIPSNVDGKNARRDLKLNVILHNLQRAQIIAATSGSALKDLTSACCLRKPKTLFVDPEY